MVTYNSLSKRIFFIRRKPYDQEGNIFQEYLARFDAVLQSIGWTDEDFLKFIDASWDVAFREPKRT